MRHGWIYIYEIPPATARFDELAEFLELRGLSLAYPPSGSVIRLSPVGDQIMTSKEELRDRFRDSSEVAFNFYLDSSTNVFCSFDRLDEATWREGYSLDGKNEEQCSLVIDTIVDLFRKRAQQNSAFAFIADRYAELHRHCHWDDFVLGNAPSPPEWPLLLGFSRSFEKISAVPRQMYNAEEHSQYVLFGKKVK